MKYSVTNLNDNNYDLIGIKLSNGKTCCYWCNKGNVSFNRIIVIFDNKNVVDVKNGEVCISLNGIDNEEDILDMIEAFGRELYKNKINITKISCDFIVDNKDEELIVSNVINKFMLKGNIIKSDKYSYLTENLDDAINNISISGDNKVVESDNSINNYTYYEDKAPDNDDINLDLKKRKLLSEWLNNPDMLLEISSLSKVELDKKLTDAVTNNSKGDYKEINNIDNSFSRVSNNMSIYEEENVNDEFDVNNNLSNTFEYSTSEEDNLKLEVDSKQDIINSDVSNSPATDDNDTSSLNVIASSNSPVDDYFWSDDGLGKLPTSKELYSETISKQNSISEDKVRVLKRPDRPVYPRYNRNRGAISIAVIIFIISLLFLIGSVIILYLMK